MNGQESVSLIKPAGCIEEITREKYLDEPQSTESKWPFMKCFKKLKEFKENMNRYNVTNRDEISKVQKKLIMGKEHARNVGHQQKTKSSNYSRKSGKRI